MRKFLPLLAMLGACSRPMFREEDNGRQVSVDQGRVFTIAREAAPSAAAPEDPSKLPAVEIRGESVRLLSIRPDPETGGKLFEFRADRPGPAEITFSREDEGARVSDYALLVRVWQPIPVHRARVGLRIGWFHRGRCRR